MKEMKLREFLQIVMSPAFVKLCDARYTTGKANYEIVKFTSRAKNKVKEFDQVKKRINEQFCEKGEDGKPVFITTLVNGETQKSYNIPEDKMPEFQKQMEDVLDEPLNWDWRKMQLKVDEIPNDVPPSVIVALEGVLEIQE